MPVCAAENPTAYETGVTVLLDNKELDFSGAHAPVIKDDRSLVPMRIIFEALGAEVIWNESEQSVTAVKDGRTIKLTIDSTEIEIDGQASVIDAAPILLPYNDYADTTMVPLRAVSEAFDCDVRWDESTYTVMISTAADTVQPQATPLPDFSAESITNRISVYDDQLAFIKNNGTVWYMANAEPYMVSSISNAVSVAIGKSDGYALTDSGEVYAWSIGNDTAEKIAGLSDIIKIDAGTSFGVALGRNGKVYAWGKNDKGQLGNGTTIDCADPTEADVTGIVDIAASAAHAAAVDASGTVYTWGENSEGQLGRGSINTKYSSTPGKITNMQNITSVYAGPNGCAAIRSDKSIYCWGTVYLGELGSDEEELYFDEETPLITDEYGCYRFDKPRRMPYCYYNIDKMQYEGGILLNAETVSCGEYQYAAICGGKVYMWGDSPNISSRLNSQYLHYYAAEYTRLPNITEIYAVSNKIAYAVDIDGDIYKLIYGKTEKIASIK